MRYIFDIDNTICSQKNLGLWRIGGETYKNAKPYKDRIAKINKLYYQGHTIVYSTARGYTTGIDWRDLTEKQLHQWGCKYHKLIMGKPGADFYIDDKAILADDFFKEPKYAIVTGGLGGIGSAIVEALNEINYNVRIIDIKNEENIEIDIQMEKIFNEKDNLDVLVNCAGITHSSFEYWNDVLRINLEAPYRLSKLAFEKMKKKGGNIINITSLWSERGFKNNLAYGASKGGLKMLSKCLAMEGAKYNIRVNNLGLGYFKTNMTKYSWKHRRKKITNNIPLGRWGKPEDIKEAIKFLVKSEYVTGTTVFVDGGWLANGGLL